MLMYPDRVLTTPDPWLTSDRIFEAVILLIVLGVVERVVHRPHPATGVLASWRATALAAAWAYAAFLGTVGAMEDLRLGAGGRVVWVLGWMAMAAARMKVVWARPGADGLEWTWRVATATRHAREWALAGIAMSAGAAWQGEAVYAPLVGPVILGVVVATAIPTAARWWTLAAGMATEAAAAMDLRPEEVAWSIDDHAGGEPTVITIRPAKAVRPSRLVAAAQALTDPDDEWEADADAGGVVLTYVGPPTPEQAARRAEEARIRAALATGLGVPAEELVLDVAWASEGHGVERITVGLPDRYLPSRDDARLREVVTRRVGNPGWTVEVDALGGTATIVPGEAPRLPDVVPLATLLPGPGAPWHELPIGSDPAGQPVALDLLATPHIVLTGQTGSGKTIGLVGLAVQALARGWDLVVVDPTKAGLDFASLRPWCSGWGTESLEQAAATLKAAYAEVPRRKELLLAHGAVKWSDLPEPVRDEHGIRPVLVIVDEASSLVLQEAMPKGLPKGHPTGEQITARNIARAEILDLMGRIAREARFAGIHLCLGIQRPDASIMGGEMRSNLGARVQLVAPGSPPAPEALRMLFPAEVAASAGEVIEALDDGHSKGLAVVHAEGGALRGLRVAYAAPAEIPDLLEQAGVPHAAGQLTEPAVTEPAPEPVTEPAPEPAPNPAPDLAGW